MLGFHPKGSTSHHMQHNPFYQSKTWSVNYKEYYFMGMNKSPDNAEMDLASPHVSIY